ncbi:MAG: hypothetical protein AB1486_34575, partial [Planctomycetota bacterium]
MTRDVEIRDQELLRAASTFQYDEADLPILITDEDLIQTRVVYDERDLPWEVYAAYQTDEEIHWTFDYTDDGELELSQEPVNVGARTPLLRHYDEYDRLQRWELADGTYAEVGYDEQSRIVYESLWAEVAGQGMTEVARSEHEFQEWHARPTEVRDVVKNENGTAILRTTSLRFHYNPAGMVSSLEGNGERLGTIAYDVLGRIEELRDHQSPSNIEQWQYDAASGFLAKRLLRHWNPATSDYLEVAYDFDTDEIGRIIQVTKSSGTQS